MDGFHDFFDSQYRLAVLKIFGAAVLLVLFGKLFSLTVFSGEYYRGLSLGNRTAQIPIIANRGVVYDRFDNPLVINFPAFLLDGECKNGICKSKIITKEEAMLEKNSRVVSSRKYLYGPETAHVIGYINLSDNKGVMGVEGEYNEILRGTDGRELIEVDALGNKLRTLGSVPPVSGKDIKLAISLELQKVAQKAMAGKRGAIIATNPGTGQVLALFSSPTFDPNIFTSYFPGEVNRDLEVEKILKSEELPLFDRAIGASYPPGSTFKIISAAAGLESGAITAETKIEDTGVMVIGPFKFPNWKWLRDGGTEGVLDIVGAIKRSNDIFFYQLGGKVGVDGLTSMAEKFGLGQTTGIDLPGEITGNVPNSVWREKNARDWYLGDTYHLSIGQADLLTTPLQVNSWTNAIANGGVACRPQVIFEIKGGEIAKSDCRNLGLKEATIKLISKGLTEACSTGGTGWPLFNYKVNGKDIAVACKTGTAEFGDLSKGLTHAWLTGYAPIDKPEISVTVIVEGGGEGSDVAAPIAKKIFDEWFER